MLLPGKVFSHLLFSMSSRSLCLCSCAELLQFTLPVLLLGSAGPHEGRGCSRCCESAQGRSAMRVAPTGVQLSRDGTRRPGHGKGAASWQAGSSIQVVWV